MGMMLSRPLIINERHCSVDHPSVNLEYDASKPDLPCPHKHMELQQQLCEAIVGDYDGSKPTIHVKDAEFVMTAVNKWLDALPPVYRLIGTDTRYDKTDPYLVLQRLQTVCMGYSSILSVLKTYLTQTFEVEADLTPKKLREFQNIAIDKSVQLMDIAQQLADIFIPDYNKYFLIVFTPFDTAALLCSAIIHDTRFRLPRRNEILQMIAKALTLLRRFVKVTKTGAVAESVISQLISKFNLTPQESTIFYSSPSSSSDDSSAPSSKRHAPAEEPRKNSDSSVPGLSPDVEPSISTSTSGSAPTLPALSTATSNQPSPTTHAAIVPPSSLIPTTTAMPDPAYVDNFSVQDMAIFDFGPLGHVFDWQHVNLFDENGHPFDFTGGSV
jgi:hypothetical protein